MDCNIDSKDNSNGLRQVVCAFGLLIALAALPAFGQQVHQLSYNNSYWADQNLNGVQSDGISVAAYLTTPNNQSHVYYLASGNLPHVHQSFYNGVSWADDDLTVLSGGPAARSKSATAGFSVGNFQYVYYTSADAHIHQLLYNNVQWADSDLTALSGGAGGAVNVVSRLVAFTTSPALHIYYTDLEDNDVHQLFSNDGKTWQNQDLTLLAGLAPGSGGSLQSGFNIGNLQYVYYVDQKFDLHQLSYNNSSWSDANLTVSTKTSGLRGVSVASFVIPGTNKIRLYFTNQSNGHLWQFASGNGTNWTSTDLTSKSKGPVPDNATPIAGYVTTPSNLAHVFYTYKSHVLQIYQTTASTWSFEDLTVSGNGSPVDSLSTLAGFSLQNEQFVFYQTP